MTIPDYAALMLPLLRLASDGQEHRAIDAAEQLAEEFALTADERAELLPNNRQAVLVNRISWARIYLRRAGLLDNSGRGVFRITESGSAVLEQNPDHIDVRFLRQFPEFVEFQGGPARALNDQINVEKVSTPHETLALSYETLRRALAQDLLDRVKSSPPRFFEQLVVDLLVAMGYGGSRADAGRAVGQSGDNGVDGIINQDPLGLDTIYLQAKRWDGTVGRPVVQGFAGSLEGFRAHKGVFITTSSFSQDAGAYVERIGKTIILIDGEKLAELMMDHGIGVTDVETYRVKRIDEDYFGGEQVVS